MERPIEARAKPCIDWPNPTEELLALRGFELKT